MHLHEYTALDLAELIDQKQISPAELTRHCLERIDKYNSTLNAFITVDPEGAMQTAKAAEKCAEPGLLHGLPIAIKDLSLTKGLRSTSGSLTLKDHVPQEDSVAVERVRRAGAIIVGKSNTPEFGYKGVTDNRLLPPCANPWDTSRTSGGSSGGSAAAIASGLCPLAEGTDGAGSIRIPAGFCGAVGVKPSFARVPRYPIPDIYYNLSHTGPITSAVADAILLLAVQSGPDLRDPASMTDSLFSIPECQDLLEAKNPAQFYKALRRFTELDEGDPQLRLAWSPDLGYAPVDPEVRSLCQKAVQNLEQLGHAITEANPGFSDPEPIELNIWNVVYAERYAPMSPETRELFTPELAGLVDLGTQVSAYQMGRDAMARTQLYYKTQRFFDQYDVLITPTLPVEAFPHSQQRPASIDGREINTLFGWTPFTYPFNLTGQPAVTVPAGFTKNHLPVGIQLVGPRGSEMRLLKLAAQFEKIKPWPRLAPQFID
ncbi:MAG: amidase family protein [bacterium]|nr:amidase family protein [bacterium]